MKLLNFGLAKPIEDAPDDTGPEAATLAHASQPGMVVGTPVYMSPEQARGERANARSDLFAFGVVLHEMLSGRGAFDYGSVAETLNAVRHGLINYPLLAQHDPLLGNLRQESRFRALIEAVRFQSDRFESVVYASLAAT